MIKTLFAAVAAFAALSFFSAPVAVADDFEKELMETSCNLQGSLFQCQTYSAFAPETVLSEFSTPYVCPFKADVDYVACLQAGKDYGKSKVTAGSYDEYFEMAKSVMQYRMNDAALEEARFKFFNEVILVGDEKMGTNTFERSQEFIAVAMTKTMG